MNYYNLRAIGRRSTMLVVCPLMLLSFIPWILLVIPIWVLTGQDIHDQMDVLEEIGDKYANWVDTGVYRKPKSLW